jgi:hypothetical protein
VAKSVMSVSVPIRGNDMVSKLTFDDRGCPIRKLRRNYCGTSHQHIELWGGGASEARTVADVRIFWRTQPQV